MKGEWTNLQTKDHPKGNSGTMEENIYKYLKKKSIIDLEGLKRDIWIYDFIIWVEKQRLNIYHFYKTLPVKCNLANIIKKKKSSFSSISRLLVY